MSTAKIDSQVPIRLPHKSTASKSAVQDFELSWSRLLDHWTSVRQADREHYGRLEDEVEKLHAAQVQAQADMQHEQERRTEAQARVRELEEASTNQDELIKMLKNSYRRKLLDRDAETRRANERADTAESELRELHEVMSASAREDWHKAQKIQRLEQQLSEQKATLDQLATQQRREVETRYDVDRREPDSSARTTRAVADEDHRQRVQAVRRQLEKRFRAKMQAKNSSHRMQLGLLKQEICESKEAFEEVQTQHEDAERRCSALSKQLDSKELELSELDGKFNASETERASLQAALSDLKTDTDALQRLADERSDSLEQAVASTKAGETKLALIQATVTSFSAIPSLNRHLKQLRAHPAKVCCYDHEYHYMTDCGALVCCDCLNDTVSVDPAGSPFSACDNEGFEFSSCQWCSSATWTWQRLRVPFSMSCEAEIESLWELISMPLSSTNA